MNSVTVSIDVRERDLIEILNRSTLPEGVVIETVSLDIGDIRIVGSDTSIDKLLFERKTLSDLAASIKDGRYREQKQRILSEYSHAPGRVTYILECSQTELSKIFSNDSASSKINGLLNNSYISSLLSLQFRDGFNLFQTASTLDTAAYILAIASRMAKSPDKLRQLQAENEPVYVNCLKLKTKKNANITPAVCYIMQLSQVPGISAKIAQDIAKVYPSMSILIENVAVDGAKAFKDIEGIGLKKGEKLVEYLSV